MLVAQNLSKIFHRKKDSFYAVKNANLTLFDGDFVSVFGESGSGKSTLLKMLSGMISPSEGNILWNQESYFAHDDIWRAELRNEFIGIIPQEIFLLNDLTVLQNVLLPRTIAKNFKKTRSALSANAFAISLLERLGVAHLANEFAQNLSGGEIRRIAFARALMNEPQIIIADEPTSNLDDENSRLILKIFQEESQKGNIVIVATHDEILKNISQRIYFMKRGVLSEVDSLNL